MVFDTPRPQKKMHFLEFLDSQIATHNTTQKPIGQKWIGPNWPDWLTRKSATGIHEKFKKTFSETVHFFCKLHFWYSVVSWTPTPPGHRSRPGFWVLGPKLKVNAHTQQSSAVRLCFWTTPAVSWRPTLRERGPDLHPSHLGVNENDSESFER